MWLIITLQLRVTHQHLHLWLVLLGKQMRMLNAKLAAILILLFMVSFYELLVLNSCKFMTE